MEMYPISYYIYAMKHKYTEMNIEHMKQYLTFH